MRHTVAALLLAGSMVTAGAAQADTIYTVDKVNITGAKSVPLDKLMAVIQEHKGSKVTQADIVADQDAITKVLGEANVVGGIKTSMAATPNKHIVVTFAIDDQGVQAPLVTKVAPKLHQQIFDGNKSVSSDTLAAATDLNIGDDLSNEKVAAAEKGIVAAYTAAKLHVGVNVNGETKAVPGGGIDVTWHIVETKAKKKTEE